MKTDRNDAARNRAADAASLVPPGARRCRGSYAKRTKKADANAAEAIATLSKAAL